MRSAMLTSLQPVTIDSNDAARAIAEKHLRAVPEERQLAALRVAKLSHRRPLRYEFHFKASYLELELQSQRIVWMKESLERTN